MALERINPASNPRIQELMVSGDPLYTVLELPLHNILWDDQEHLAVLHWNTGDIHQAQPGVVHGGLSIFAIDTVAGFAANILAQQNGNIAVTRKLEASYHAPVPVGVLVEVVAKVIDRTDWSIFLTGNIVRADDPSVIYIGAFLEMREKRLSY